VMLAQVFYELREVEAQRGSVASGKVATLRDRLASLQEQARRFQVLAGWGKGSRGFPFNQ
jgi:hypothetical protein